MRTLVVHHLIVLAVAGTVFFTNLGGPRLWDRDEPRNAGCAAEMLAANDWVTPVFNAELRTHKPVLLYWLMMTSYSVFGISEFSARFCSALLGLGTCLATYHIGRRLFSPRVGLWSSLTLAASPLFGVSARAATPDSLLVFLTTSAILVYVLATFRATSAGDDAEETLRLRDPNHFYPQNPWALVLMYGIMGLAVLAKGPVGLVLPTAVIGMFLLIMRLPKAQEQHAERGRIWKLLSTIARPFAPRHFLATCRYMRPDIALAVAVSIALPWYVWVGLRTNGDWLYGFFYQHHFGRVVDAMEGHHGSILYYPTSLLIGFFPLSVLAAPVLISTWRRMRSDGSWRTMTIFTVCWAAVYVGIFTIARTKLPSYLLPMYPALSILAGIYIVEWIEGRSRVASGWPHVAVLVLVGISLIMVVGLPIAAQYFLPGEELLSALLLIPLLGAALYGVFAWRRRDSYAAASLVVSAIIFSAAVLGFATQRIDRYRGTNQLLATVFDHSAQPKIASYGCLEPSWVFYARQPIKEFRAPKHSPEVGDFLRREQEGFLITTKDRLAELEDQLPRDVRILGDVPYFLEDEQLVIIGRPTLVGRKPPAEKLR